MLYINLLHAGAYSRESTALNVLIELFKCTKDFLFNETEVSNVQLDTMAMFNNYFFITCIGW